MNKKVLTLCAAMLLSGSSLVYAGDYVNNGISGTNWQTELNAFMGGDKPVTLSADGLKMTVNDEVTFSDQRNFLLIDRDDFVLDGNHQTWNGRIVITGENVTIKNLKINYKNVMISPNAGEDGTVIENKSAITVFASKVNLIDNEITVSSTKPDDAHVANGISIYPLTSDPVFIITGNTINNANEIANGDEIWPDSPAFGIEIIGNIPGEANNGYTYFTSKSGKSGSASNVNFSNSKISDNKINNAAIDYAYVEAHGVVSQTNPNGDRFEVVTITKSQTNERAFIKTFENAADNAIITVENATAAEVQAVIAGLGEDATSKKNLTIVTEDANIIVGEPTNIPANDKDNVEVTGAFVKMEDGGTYTLYAQGKGYLTVTTGTDITYAATVGSGAYWTVSKNSNDVYTFTNALGKKLSYNGFSEFTLTENEGNLFTLSANGVEVGTFGAAEVPMNNVTAADMNAVNEGSFSIDYRFSDQEIAEVNPFKGDVKAFEYNGDIYFASSWPSSLDGKDKIYNVSDFNKCVFVVATPEHSWNINDVRANGEGTRFAEVQGNRLVVNPSLDELKAGKYARSNAAFFVQQSPLSTNAYTLMLKEVTYLNEDRDGVLTGSNLYVALLDDEAGLIVTTITDLTKTDKVKVSGTITNSRTANASEILSSDKASIFNIKFVSTTADWTGENDKTKSEYNKYLGVNADGTFAQGAEFLNLTAPENQWIIVNANQNAKTFTFQNRELDGITFTTQLVKTDKANVYELRTVGEWVNEFAYLDKDAKDEYTEGWSFPLSGTTVQLEAVNADPEAGYVTNELDTAGLIRMSFTTVDRVIAGELFVTTDDNGVVLDQDESKAEQFSVIKFDAAATKTALSDTLYADNDYAIWSANKVQIVPDGDTIAAVSYAFKQLRADGKSYYLNHEFELAKIDEEADAPRFMVKVNKNNSYSLIPVKEWYRWDSYRDNVSQGATTYAPVETAEEYVARGNASIYYDYATREFDFNILKETPGTSYEHKPQHVTMEAVNGGYLAMDSVNMDGIVAPVSSLRSSYTKDQLTFKLDTADSEAVTPSFMISHMGNYMYNATDSLNYYNEGTASDELVKKFGVEIDNEYRAKAIFQSADLEKVEDLNNYKFQIVLANDSENEYVIRSVNDYHYVAAHNQKLYFTDKVEDALKVYVEKTDAPTANETISAGNVVVAGVDGAVVVKGAEGKNVIVSTILGKVVANEVVSSDNAQIATPAGIVVVSVDGESFKVVVK